MQKLVNHPNRRVRRPASGMTLLELTLSLVVLGVMGLSITSMLFAVSGGTAGRTDMHNTAMKERIISGRVDAGLRDAKMVLAQGTDYIVLWIADTRKTDTPNISEIRRIERDSATGKIYSYTASFPGGWDAATLAANDNAYALNSDFNAVTTTLKAGSYFPKATWGTGVTSWTIKLNNADPQSARLVSYQMTVTSGTLTDTIASAVLLRGQ